MSEGIIYIAYGPRARHEATESIRSLRQHTDLPVAVVGEPVGGAQHITLADGGWGGRLAKLSLDRLSPWEQTLYLDADTRIQGDISIGFDILADGWELVIAPSTRQGNDLLGNVSKADRQATFVELLHPLALQAGVFWWRTCEAMHRLFAAWREEWARFKRHDQGALLRALYRVPVRVWLVGNEFNGGSVIRHLYGRAA